jgi:hypothetical protein
MFGYRGPVAAVAVAVLGLASYHALGQNARFGFNATATPTKVRSVPAEETAAAFKNKNWKVPKTSWGNPDLQGTWTSDDMRSVPMVRPDQFGTRQEMTPEEFEKRAERDQAGRNRAVNDETLLRNEWGIRTFGYTSLVIDPPDGKIPALTKVGTERAAKQPRGTYGPGPYNTTDQFSLYERCITRGLLGSILPVIYGNGLTITQAPGKVVISYEMIHDTRTIYTDGRPLPGPEIRQYMGLSRGHWEGNTLVVEATHFTDKTSLGVNGNGTPNSAELKITERYTRIDPDMINYTATIEDPATYTKPWTIRETITHQPNYHVYEYSCHEGNSAIELPLSGERAYDKKVAEAKAKGLPIPKREDYAGFAAYAPPKKDAGVYDVNTGEKVDQ